METQLTRVGRRWYIGNLPVTNGQTTTIGEGWTLIVRIQGSRNTVEVFLGDELQYRCNISRAEEVWLFDNGVAELTRHDAPYKALVQQALAALAQRRAGPGVLVKVTWLPRGKTVGGLTFRTRMGANNYFSDGTLQRLSMAHARITMRCVGGSYLVQTHRHEDSLAIFAVDVTVQTGCHVESLERCLRQLA